MNSDRQRHPSCSRLPLLRSRAQSTRERTFTAPSLSVSPSPRRQRKQSKWRCASIAGGASPKLITNTAAVPAWRQTGTGPWRLFGDAQRCESKEREVSWLVILFLKESGRASHVCSRQCIDEVASNLKETCAQSAQWMRSQPQPLTRIVSQEADALSAVLKQEDLADQLVNKSRKTLSLVHLLLSFAVFWGHSLR